MNCSTLCRKMNRFILVISLFSLSCKKLVETPPPTNVLAETNTFSVDATAIAVLNGIYISMNEDNQPIQGRKSISLLGGLSADELTLYSGIGEPSYEGYYRNSLSALDEIGTQHWAPLFSYIFRCNAAIEGLMSPQASSLTPIVKQQLLGEARFLRAFFYFYLVSLFGDVPLVLSTDPSVNVSLSRTSKEEVFKQIISDLVEAEKLLSSDYLDGTLLTNSVERVRPTRWAANAFLARVYLFIGDFANAEAMSSLLIGNNHLYGPLPDLNDVFLKNSREAIWQLQPTAIDFNTTEATVLVLPEAGPSDANPVYVSDILFNSFEPDDLRALPKNWIDTIAISGTTYRFPYKYKLNLPDGSITSNSGSDNMQEYFMMLRVGEQYLIRAEARAQQSKVAEAKEDLNVIRTRAGLPNTTADSKEEMLAAILHERRVELFSEWGHRWIDLKRTGTIDAVMSIVTPLKSNGGSWESYQQLYPIPKTSDIDRAPNIKQNTGY
ncbi:RagB/SusD family nutrient uptake outer membrane protein [Longitalea luteola]|uniref:RagB/SusD family nutrient uptake outer membrane protein n=1 Tax=Longitalea luteola TaxID=2812563 RepID=UPI001A95C8B2|nr:RagB/SusD family nutrient uptake outer membrane protein [Longitalea luteola]